MDATVFCWFVTYCHLPKISLWRLRRFTKSQSHLNSTNPVTALCTWRIQNHQATCHRVCSFTHSASDPLSSPPAVSGAPGLRCSQHPRRRPRPGAAPPRQCGRCQPPCAAVFRLRRRRARRRQRLEGSTPWLSTAQPPLQWEKLQSVE